MFSYIHGIPYIIVEVYAKWVSNIYFLLFVYTTLHQHYSTINIVVKILKKNHMNKRECLMGMYDLIKYLSFLEKKKKETSLLRLY